MQGSRLLPLFAAAAAITAGMAALPATAAGDRFAIVAGGVRVTLAPSRFSNRELQARRPQVEQLIPTVR